MTQTVLGKSHAAAVQPFQFVSKMLIEFQVLHRAVAVYNHTEDGVEWFSHVGSTVLWK